MLRYKTTFGPRSFYQILISWSLLLSVHAAAIPESVDVAIVGAGLSGLSAAKHLIDGGKTVLVLEARNRVGGKVLNRPLSNGGVTEVGAEFVGPTQDKVLELIAELGLQTFDTYNEGQAILWRNEIRIAYEPTPLTGGLPPTDPASLVQIASIVAQLDAWAAEIDVNAPWAHPKAEEWDSMTLAEWLDLWLPLPDTKFMIGVFSKAIWAAEKRELSLLYAIAYIASAGNETSTGSISRLIAIENGAQEKRVEGGTGLIPQRLAEVVGTDKIALNTAVTCITRTSDGYNVISQAGVVKAKRVVLALAPPLLNGITFSPALPDARQQLNQKMKMGSIGKGIAVYDTPFWRADENLNAQVTSDAGATRVTFDNSPSDASFGAVMGFLLGDEMRELDTKTEEEIQQAVISDYVRYFGQKAENITEFVVQRWDLEEFSKGGPTAFAPPNVLSQYGPALREPVDGIHFAGTELGEYWTGYMDGAIRSGQRAAREILETD